MRRRHAGTPRARRASGSAGSRSPSSSAIFTMRSQRSGERTTRRMLGKPCASRKRAVDAVRRDHEVLDQVLRALLRRLGRRSTTLPSVEDRPRLDGLEVERAVLVPQLAHARRRPCPAASGSRRGLRRARPSPAARPSPSSHAATRVVGELRLVVDARAVDVAARARCRRSSTIISMTIARRSSSSLSDVRSVDSFSGSIGKMRAAV